MPAVLEWGLRDYSESLDAMRELVRARRAGVVDDSLVLVEHPPVVTVGVEGDDGSAATTGLPVVNVERGGRATYHGPGQLVGYPIVDLTARGRDVRRFVHEVEEIVVRALAGFGVTAGHVKGRRGVWVDGERKIASIGVAVDHWVTFHGFALNVDPDLSAFERFHPCGFSGSVMTSVSQEAGRPVRVSEVAPRVVDAWNELFSVPTVLSTPDPVSAGTPSARA
ncbi:MAG TPA: lipoyl(octanoyl) transferase LipB [Thermoplasmata archaeon]|nr:lipoyl(octanoyl) transferase LipB [Thermoplasmata archaeon]